jgi:hypothetical protein
MRLAATAGAIMRGTNLRLAARVFALEVAQPLRRFPVDCAGAAMEVGELRRCLVDPLGRLVRAARSAARSASSSAR